MKFLDGDKTKYLKESRDFALEVDGEEKRIHVISEDITNQRTKNKKLVAELKARRGRGEKTLQSGITRSSNEIFGRRTRRQRMDHQ